MMIQRLAALAMLLLSGSAACSTAGAQREGYDVTRVRLEELEERFLREWLEAWRKAPSSRNYTEPAHGPASPGQPLNPRSAVQPALSYHDHLVMIPCWFPQNQTEWMGISIRHLFPYVIRADRGTYKICPSWLRSTPPEIGDERLNIDTVLQPDGLSRVRAARASVLGELARAAEEFPADDWIIGQRIRFLLDQRDTSAAVTLVRNCRASAWWCNALDGYVQHYRADVRAADSLFGAAYHAAPPTTRCVWNDLHLLLEPAERVEYSAMTCSKRDDVNQTLWWLSDPLWIEPGNARRAEHFARMMTIALHETVAQDGRFEWAPEYGGSTVREMITRYGWPTVATGTVGTSPSAQAIHGSLRPFETTTNEYSPDRVHAVPPWRVIAAPYSARNEDWILTAATAEQLLDVYRIWWPAEHSARDAGAFVQLLGAPQVAMFRRDRRTTVAAAMNLPAATLGLAAGEPARGAMVLSPSADSMTFFPFATTVDGTARAVASAGAGAQLFGIELHAGARQTVGARTRVGIQVTPPLSALAGTMALSDIAFLTAIDGADTAPPLDTAASRMLGSLELVAPERVTLFWESYGVAAGDSLSFALTMERTDSPSLLQSIGSLIGRGRNSRIKTTWVSRVGSSGVSSSVAIAGHQITLNLANLAAGSYRLTVGAIHHGAMAGSATREFRIVREKS